MFNSSVPPKMSICCSLFFSFFGFSLFETKPPQPASEGLPSRDRDTLKNTVGLLRNYYDVIPFDIGNFISAFEWLGGNLFFFILIF